VRVAGIRPEPEKLAIGDLFACTEVS